MSAKLVFIVALAMTSGPPQDPTTPSGKVIPSSDSTDQSSLIHPADGVPSLDSLLATEADLDDLESSEVRTVESGWWHEMVSASLRPTATPINLGLENTLVRALRHSRQIQVFAELPLIRATSITEADAAFDWHAFLDSRWDDTSDPVGNSLTTGSDFGRFRDHNLTLASGLRRRTRSGGQLELSQQFGIQENNSTYFVPNNQGTSRIVLNYTHPLMRGRGKCYNRSLVCLASVDKEIADDEFRRQLESHLLEVTRAYWALYLERGTMLQKMLAYSRAKETVARLEIRRSIDATSTQITSAQAALKTRRSRLIRAISAGRNAEARLRTLVNDPEFSDYDNTELIPMDQPSFQTFPIEMRSAVAEAMQHRPEVSQAVRQVKAAGIRLQMSKNELMPVLNLVTETYVAGLDAHRDIGGAWGNQFDQGEPGYSVGLQFEIPIQNRAARARHLRRCHELRQIRNQYLTTLDTISLETQVAVREVMTSQQELIATEEAMLARQEQLNYLEQRWEQLPGEGVSASLTLENLLTAQDHLAAAEFQYLQSQMTFNLSLTNLARATGTLLQHEMVSIGHGCVHGLPTQVLTKPELHVSGVSDHTARPR